MFSKHVWHDRRHQAKVFITDDGIVSGTLVAYRGAVCVINPRPEILSALYQESKIKRILSLNAVVLTDNTMEYARGLCVLLNYSRGMRRKKALTVVTREDTQISNEVLHSCCSRLLNNSAFDIHVVTLAANKVYAIGEGNMSFVRPPTSAPEESPYLVVATGQHTLHYYDETHRDAPDELTAKSVDRPNLVIRAAELPGFAQQSRSLLNVLA